jgi:hypothetical protein
MLHARAPKDSWLLKNGNDVYRKFEVESKILQDNRYVNDYMPYHMKELVGEALRACVT